MPGCVSTRASLTCPALGPVIRVPVGRHFRVVCGWVGHGRAGAGTLGAKITGEAMAVRPGLVGTRR